MIVLDLNVDEALRQLKGTQRNQVPFAMALAMNRTLEESQTALRTQLHQRFTIAPERKQFMERLIKFDRQDRARKDRLVATLSIADPGGKRGKGRSVVLARHVFGGSHLRADDAPFFIPSDYLRPTDTTLIPPRFYPANLRLADRMGIGGATAKVLEANRRVTSRGTVVQQGKRNTWVVPFNNPKGRTPGIYQRLSDDRSDVQLLWLYRRRVNLGRPRLDFNTIVEARVRERFVTNFEGMISYALRTAR